MPTSRARTAICSAPLECPSRPGLPTRIFGRRPSVSLQPGDLLAQLVELARRARGRAGLADAGRGAVAAEHLAQGRATTRRSWRRRGRRRSSGPSGSRALGGVAPRLARASASAASTAAWSRSERQLAHRLDLLGLDGGVDDQDAALGVGGERRDLGLGEAVLARRRSARRTRSGGCARGGSRPARAFM